MHENEEYLTEFTFKIKGMAVAQDEQSEEEEGICMNCGEVMDYSPMHPWCPKCDEEGKDV